MSVTYTADWMIMARGIFFLYVAYPFRWLGPILFLLLPLPFLILGNFMGAEAPLSLVLGITGAWAAFFIFIGLMGEAGDIAIQSGKAFAITITPAGVRYEAWGRKPNIEWKIIAGVVQTETDILLIQNSLGGGTFVPLAAFTDPREAQRFYELAVSYREAAKRGQPLPPSDETGVWPPAPRPGNSAEPGDTPSC